MSFSGGVYTLPGPALVTGEVVSATENNQFRNDVAGAFNLTFLRNGTSTATANLPMGGYKLTGLGVATTSGDALSYGQAAVVSDITATGSITVNSGTANGVAYLNGSKVLTTGSALTFDGSKLSVNSSGTGATFAITSSGVGVQALGTYLGNGISYWGDSGGLNAMGVSTASNYLNWIVNNSEQMRLTSTGLGIGTSSPNRNLEVVNASGGVIGVASTTTSANTLVGRLAMYSTGYGNAFKDYGGEIRSYSIGGIDACDLRFYTSASATSAERMRLDSSGNLGLGVTPSAWTTYKALQIGECALSAGGTDIEIVSNAYYNSGWKYRSTSGGATRYSQQENAYGAHAWYTAPSGTAGSAISFTQAMTLDASGRLLVGTTTAGIGGSVQTALSLGNGTNTVFASLKSAGGQEFLLGVDNGIGVFCGAYSNDPFIIRTNNTERMRIDSSGNVGIGTSSPSQRLQVQSAASLTRTKIVSELSGNIYYSGLEFARSGVSGGALIETIRNPSVGGVGFGFYTTADNAAEVAGNYTERMRIDSSGNLLVGTTSNYIASNNKFVITSSNPSAGYTMTVRQESPNTGAYYLMAFVVGSSTQTGYISSNGTSTTYSTSSDYRLKENIQPMQNALGVVAQLNPVTYTWKADGSNGQGFIAHELQSVVPDCVTGEKDAVDADGKPVYQGIDTSFLVATLTKAIQEQQEQINQLKAEVAALKGN